MRGTWAVCVCVCFMVGVRAPALPHHLRPWEHIKKFGSKLFLMLERRFYIKCLDL